MTDLVKTVARAVVDAIIAQDFMDTTAGLSDNLIVDWLDQSETDFGIVARAAIAAVLDDMAEPSEVAWDAIWTASEDYFVADHISKDGIRKALAAMLAQYRKEMLG